MIFIDVLKKDYLKFQKYNKVIDKDDLKDNVSFLKYIHLAYEISITNLSRIFNVSRQSIYNYLKTPTDKLPKRVIDKIVYIYGYNSFNDILSVELILAFQEEYKEEIESELANDIPFNEINHKFKYLFKRNSNRENDLISLNETYDFRIKWKRSISGLATKKSDPIEQYIVYNELKSKNSSLFIIKLFEKLNKLEKDDYEFIKILDNYLNSIRRKR
jgi:hypothetical protein